VVGAAEEAGERGEGAGEQQLEVALLARRQVPGGPVARGGLELRRPFGRGEQVEQTAAVRLDQVVD
jgi:hypothetical protein